MKTYNWPIKSPEDVHLVHSLIMMNIAVKISNSISSIIPLSETIEILLSNLTRLGKRVYPNMYK